MKKLIIIIAVCVYAQTAFAWGKEGHIVVAKIAQSNLTNKAKAQIKTFMGSLELASIATWADDVRNSNEFKYSKTWHYVDIPFSEQTFDSLRDCNNGDCAIAAIDSQIRVLRSATASRTEKQIALKFLVHFMGDVHQPLHCYDNNDRGGNLDTVYWFDTITNLHSVWDSKFIEKTNQPRAQYIARIIKWLTTAQKKMLVTGSLTDWVNAAHLLTVNTKMIVKNHSKLGVKYFNTYHPIVEHQLATAGIRLAKILNDIFQ